MKNKKQLLNIINTVQNNIEINIKTKKNTLKGFTLIELIISLIIMGIITSVALPSYSKIQIKAKEGIQKTIGHNLQLAIESYYMSSGKYPEGSNIHLSQLTQILNSENCYNTSTKNPFTNKAHAPTDTSGLIRYSHDKTSHKYKLTLFGHKNTPLLTLNN